MVRLSSANELQDAPVPARVLLLARHLDSGGVTTHMFNLARGLKERGCEVAVCSRGRTGVHEHGPEWFEAHGIKHFEVPFPPRRLDWKRVLAAARGVVSLDGVVRRFKPSIVHVQWRSTSFYAGFVSLRYGVPYVSTLHLERIPAGRTLRALGTFWGRQVIAISSETRSYLTDTFGVPPGRIHIVYNGADPDHFRPGTEAERARARSALGVSGERPVLSLVGRLVASKGHRLLLEAVAELRRRKVEASVVLAGAGPKESEIRQAAVDLGVADLAVFPGYVDSRAVYWASDLAVLPSEIEGFPMTIVEAMMCGVVPLRTPAGGAKDQIDDGVNGFIVPFGDPRALADKLELLIEQPSLRQSMAQAAALTARSKFSQGSMVRGTLEVYRKALDSKVPKGTRR